MTMRIGPVMVAVALAGCSAPIAAEEATLGAEELLLGGATRVAVTGLSGPYRPEADGIGSLILLQADYAEPDTLDSDLDSLRRILTGDVDNWNLGVRSTYRLYWLRGPCSPQSIDLRVVYGGAVGPGGVRGRTRGVCHDVRMRRTAMPPGRGRSLSFSACT